MRKFIGHITGSLPDVDWNIYEPHLKVKKVRKGPTIQIH